MRILYLHQYFMTRSGLGSTRSYEFARRWVKQGHHVSIVTAAAEPASRAMTTRSDVEGIDVVRINAGHADYMRATGLGYFARIFGFVKFALASSLAVLRGPRPDVVFATSPPLTIGIPALVASKWHRAPLVFEVRDLWPEAPIQFGALRSVVGITLARRLQRAIYGSAAHIVALSPGIRDGVIAAAVAPAQVTVIPNASDLDLFSPAVDGQPYRKRLGLDRQFVCSYFGAMGEANDLTQVVEAAALLHRRGQKDVAFVLHGTGKRLGQLKALCREHGLTNVILSEPCADKRTIAELAAASDVCMTIYKNLPILHTCSPNKLFDTFAAGRPAIVNSPGWLKDLVEQHQVGFYVRPDDAAHLADCVVFLREHPALLKAFGRNARRLAEESFDRNKLAVRLLSVFEQVVRSGK